MNILRNVGIFGDSILKGVQVDPENKRYSVQNHIDFEQISNKHQVVLNNYSLFGCTIKKGCSMLQKRIENGKLYDIVVIEYGGNDCDFNWKEIAGNPEAEHTPNTPLDIFVKTYCQIINMLKKKCIIPILTNLPPLEPQRFFDWFCKGLNKDNVLKWLGGINTIYRVQETYSRMVEKIAAETKTHLVDLRSAFLEHRRIDALLCEDGTHPNTDGQKIITETFLNLKLQNSVTA
ncbi:MAG: SGNH/GDSL hydrolase family protein [Spirochaetaceae bacterium]|jgi:lysophospholipase L1-like esterase|nr:SGNH/GDSL hydrolase family protein [Spirochaetaceae bacterium]